MSGLPERVPAADPGFDLDFSACETEPIHVPGAIQPHGWLLTIHEESLRVVHASANLGDLVAGGAGRTLGRPLHEVLGGRAAEAVTHHIRVFRDVRDRSPLHVPVPARRGGTGGELDVDVVLHRPPAAGDPQGDDDPLAEVPGDLVVVELEPTMAPPGLTYEHTYRLVRESVHHLNRSVALDELVQLTATAVRELTGFDRVMVYQFDEEWNGRVVAEAAHPSLESLMGLHYPASDIPPQARRLYERNWVRYIPTSTYDPVPLLATAADGGRPLDMTYSMLRSVSPVHLQYLRNMGVRASMSVSLMNGDRLWGLIACHHYDSELLPPFSVRAAAELLGSTLSSRLVERANDERTHRSLAAERTLTRIGTTLADDRRPVAERLGTDDTLLDLVPADGVVVQVEGARTSVGDAAAMLSPPQVDALVGALRRRREPVVASAAIGQDDELAPLSGEAAGLLAVLLPDDQFVLWLRRERRREISWGGDPTEKTLDVRGGELRLGPRRSFAAWSQTVGGRSLPWAEHHVDIAEKLRSLLTETLYTRTRSRMKAAEILQRSLLPTDLPQPKGWTVVAEYDAAAGGTVGGDWFDAVRMPDGRVAVLVGDVAGHGLEAAATMGQIRNALRAFLLRGEDPASALDALDRIVEVSLPEQMATLVMALVHPGTGRVDIWSVGHLAPAVRRGDADAAVQLGVAPSPPLGLGMASPAPATFTLRPGEVLALFTDGLVERRGESIQDGIDRLLGALVAHGDPAGGGIGDVVRAATLGETDDDVTLLLLRRE